MFKIIEKIKKQQQFKRNIKIWGKLCKTKNSKVFGVVEVGDLTHSVNMGDYTITTNDPILLSAELKK